MKDRALFSRRGLEVVKNTPGDITTECFGVAVSVSRAAIAKYYNWMTNRNFLSHSSGGYKPEIAM